jgi:serine/threonine-protein kinase RsbW
VDSLCQSIRIWLNEAGLAAKCFAVELLARESLNNALIHGNHRYADKEIRMELRVGRKWIRLQVSDEGPGFNWRKGRHRRCELEAESGRGMALFAHYAEQIRFNRCGSQITLWLRRNSR